MSLDLVPIGGTGDFAWRTRMPDAFRALLKGHFPAGRPIPAVASDVVRDRCEAGRRAHGASNPVLARGQRPDGARGLRPGRRTMSASACKEWRTQ